MKKEKIIKNYRIKYTYDTGDSFSNQYGLESFLELEWNDFDVAKANLKRIEEHYRQYQECHTYYKIDKQEIFKGNENKDWFVKKDRLIAYIGIDKSHCHYIDENSRERFLKNGYTIDVIIDETAAGNEIILYTDEGNKWQFWAPWCGYFESLVGAEIISKDLETKFVI